MTSRPSQHSELSFVSYASPDRARVEPIVDYLEARGVEIWMDCKRLKAGQNWDYEIKRALDKATIVIMFLSNRSVDRRGYVQRELRVALDKREEKLIDDIYIIPVVLDDDVEIPRQLTGIQFVRASSHTCMADLEDAIRHQIGQVTERHELASGETEVSWTRAVYKESWEGLPGYEIDADYINLHSAKFSGLDLINRLLAGEGSKSVIRHKALKCEQDTSYNFGQSRFSRTSTLGVSLSDPVIVGRVLSIRSVQSWYNAGAAHGGTGVTGFRFCLDPILWLDDASTVFVSVEAVFPIIQHLAREQLMRQLAARDSVPDENWIFEGTRDWSDFGSYIFSSTGVDFTFQEYQVACYADGTQTITLPYGALWNFMKPEIVSALGLDHLRWLSEQNPFAVANRTPN